MGDMGDYFREARASASVQKAQKAEDVRKGLIAKGVSFRWVALTYTAILRVERGSPRNADYYTTTGKWKDIDTGSRHRGSPDDFLRWLDG